MFGGATLNFTFSGTTTSVSCDAKVGDCHCNFLKADRANRYLIILIVY